MPRPTDFDRLHPRWPEGAPMGLGGQFRPVGMPDSAARILLGVAKVLEDLRISGSSRRRYRSRVLDANRAAGDVDWDSVGESAYNPMIRNIIRDKIFDHVSPSVMRQLGGSHAGHAFARAETAGATREVDRILADLPQATGALAQRTGAPRVASQQVYNGTQALVAGDELVSGRDVLQYTGQTSPTGRLRFRTFGGGVSGQSGRWSNAYQSYAADSPTLLGRTLRRSTQGASEQSSGNVESYDVSDLSTGMAIRRASNGRIAEAIQALVQRDEHPTVLAQLRAEVRRRDQEHLARIAEGASVGDTATPSSPARSPAGRLRNIGAMTDQNLINLAIQMRSHRTDTEAVERVNRELRARGRTGYEIPAGSPTAPRSGSGRTQTQTQTQTPSPFSRGDRVVLRPGDTVADDLVAGQRYEVTSDDLDSDGDVQLRGPGGNPTWAAPERLLRAEEAEANPPASPRFSSGDRVRLRPGRRSRWLNSGTTYTVARDGVDQDGDVVIDDPSDGGVTWARPDEIERADAARSALPHEAAANSQQLAENIVAAFSAQEARRIVSAPSNPTSAMVLREGERLEVRTPQSGALSRIVRVRPNGSEETFAYVRHRRGARGTGLESTPLQHQISFVHGTSQILGSALRPGQFRARPRGGEHRLFTRDQIDEAAQVLSNALGAARRRTPPREGVSRPSNRPGEPPLPGMMGTPNRRRDGWGSAPSGDMLPPRDGPDRAFGIEIEMTGISYAGARTALGREGLPVDERGNYTTKNLAAWVAAHDGSLGPGDPEIKFPPLSGAEGMALMRRAVKALRDAGGRAGLQRTHGLHVHIDARDMMSREKRLELAETYANNRDLINTVVAPNRNRGAGSYAREGYSPGHGSRELALNFGAPTIEFRRLGSNLVADDIEGWSILMQSIVNYQKTHDGALPTQSSLLTFMRAIGVPVEAQEKILARVARISPSENEA